MSSKLVKRLQSYRKSLKMSLVWYESGYLHFFSLFLGKELKEFEIFLNFRVGHHLLTEILKFSNFWTLISVGRRVCFAMQNFYQNWSNHSKDIVKI